MTYIPFGIHDNISVAGSLQKFTLSTATRDFTSGPIGPQDLVSKITSASGSAWAAGLTSYYSFKASKAEVVNGEWRPWIESLASFLRANPHKKTVLTLWHEPENNFSPAEYKDYFARLNGWIKGVDPTIKTCHSALSYQYQASQNAPVASLWRTEADIHAIDIYSGRSWPLSQILPEMTVFNRWREGLVEDRPWTVTERGFIANSSNSVLRAATIRREAAWLTSSDPVAAKCERYLAWNTDGSENDPDIILDQAGLAAMVDLMLAVATPPVLPTIHRVTKACPLCIGSGEYTFEFTDGEIDG